MFICDPDESELNEVRKKYLEQYIVKNFDEISQITHKNEYKKEYRNSNTYWNNNEGIKSDWDFHNFYWENEDTVKV
ncbi:MAG: hypothetical protein LBQ59_00335 [Candidatus Peribacteria bacterium]|jgi:hypothetical protein|nr:hypothetical protein [Candidatus Peribacteria bacterium]